MKRETEEKEKKKEKKENNPQKFLCIYYFPKLTNFPGPVRQLNVYWMLRDKSFDVCFQ